MMRQASATVHFRARPLPIAGMVFALMTWLALTGMAAAQYPGNRIVFLAFVAAFSLLLALAVPPPRLYGYSFLAVFMFLGFCAKLVAYLSLDIPLIEPTGSFDSSAGAWDEALLPAIVGAVAACAVRISHLLLKPMTHPAPVVASPDWYLRQRRWVLITTVITIALFGILNLALGFYQIGVRPRLVLPAHLNVPVGWLLSMGMAMWVATLMGWELSVQKMRPRFALMLPLYEALMTVSVLSRATYLLRALSYVLVVLEFPRWFSQLLSRRSQLAMAALVASGFIVSIIAVSALRVLAYPARELPPSETAGPATSPAPVTAIVPEVVATIAKDSKPVAHEITSMLIGRWIGIEGTMAVSSYIDLDVGLLRAALVENPGSGQESLYQRVAGSSYATEESFVFGTTPGLVGVLFYSGSLWIVFGGMSLVVAFLIAFEVGATRAVRNAFVVALTGQALANGIAQMNFPYLFLVLCVQLWFTLVGLTFIASRPATVERRVAAEPVRA
jgi:hypothetical protein